MDNSTKKAVLDYWAEVGHILLTDSNNNKFVGVIVDKYNGFIVLSTIQDKLVWIDMDCIVSIEEV